MRIITISREFGSGGRELGRRLAEELGVSYYDKEIVTEIAKKMKADERYIEDKLNRGFTMNFPYTFRRSFSYAPPTVNGAGNIYAEQHNVLRQIALKKEDCVIVGRSADTILSDYMPLKLFVYADTASKIERCIKRAEPQEKLTEREIKKNMKMIDKARASYHSLVSESAWGDKKGYHLCINTTKLEIKSIIPHIAAYAGCWFERMIK